MLRLTIQTENSQVEELLAFLQNKHPNANECDLISLLSEAIKWLRTVDEFLFIVNLDAGDIASLDFVRTEPISSPHPETHAKSQEQSLTV